MTATLDPATAIVAYLKQDADVTALVSTRVFGAELPDTQTPSMPQGCVVVRLAGSPDQMGQAYQEYGDVRIEVRSYGATPYTATQVARAVHGRLKQMRRNMQGTTILHWARGSGGMQQLRDPDTEWPFTLSTYQVLAAERA